MVIEFGGMRLMRVEWESVPELDRFEGAITPVLHLSKAFERVRLPVVCASATHFNFLRMSLRVFCSIVFKGASRIRSRPSRPSSLGRRGVACSFAFLPPDAL